jgi:heptosyltransferase-1
MHETDRPRVLIARMSAIGDTILTLPVVCALRSFFPNAFLGWVVERGSSSMVLGHECLDQVIVLPRGWFTRPREILRARRELARFRFDVSIDCQGMTKSSLACRLSGARRRIGFSGEHGRELSRWINNHLVPTQNPHVTARSLELLEPLGIHRPPVEWRLPIDRDSRRNVDEGLGGFQLPHGFAVINPGATWASKRWEIDRFAAVARHVARNHNLPTLVVWGGPDELQWAEQIVEASAGSARLAPPTSLLELAALIQRARVFVSADTGPLHMAVAVGTPSIGLYGATRVEDCGPFGDPHLGLQVTYQEGSCRERRSAANDAMRMISVQMACQAIDTVMARTPDASERTAA